MSELEDAISNAGRSVARIKAEALAEANQELLDTLAHIVSQANVNPVMGKDSEGEYIARYDMPVGSIHKAIPVLARHGIVVDEFGAIHKAPRSFSPPRKEE